MTTNEMRIAILSVHSCPLGKLGTRDTGGMSVYIRELAREMGQQGFPVDIYTRTHDPADSQIYNLGPKVRLIHLDTGDDRILPKLDIYPHLPDFTHRLESFRRQNRLKYDIIFSHYWLSGHAGQFLQQLWNVPHVVMFHTLGAVKNAIGIGDAEPRLRLDTERQVAGNCQHIVATTRNEMAQMARYYDVPPARISVIPCGVNLDRFRLMDREAARKQLGFEQGKYLLYVGRIEPLKGLNRLLQAMSYLPNGHKTRLVIIGGDEQSRDEIERLQRLSDRLQLNGSVIFRGLEKQESLPFFYSAADVCVIPSYYESFGLVALESMACGTPIVATDVGNLSHIVRQGETGYVVREATPQRLAGSIANLLFKANGLKSAGAIRESVIGYSWANIARDIIRHFQKVLAEYHA